MYNKEMEKKIDNYTAHTNWNTRICDYNYIVALAPIKNSKIFDKYVAVKGTNSLTEAKIICLLDGNNRVVLQNF